MIKRYNNNASLAYNDNIAVTLIIIRAYIYPIDVAVTLEEPTLIVPVKYILDDSSKLFRWIAYIGSKL